MAKSSSDRTTPDLFAQEKRPGRPRTNLLPRQEQLKFNKRNQVKRDREKGLKRIEFKVPAELYQQLSEAAEQAHLTRSAYLEQVLTNVLIK
ncbi:LexA regulated protein [Alkalimonas sp. MEB108]|uniref:LexA regulated protein n=1 Tax=Alkalimonas cellulosilytica TaxID=3058395 RepID=A0ABU7J4N5_9GAMM|nr:LexA regulated protein [Alkalimonas sp. MEB108]MEE2001337.1 LexA regulated protein [Alkalimonas sp. MEB108]